jgi:hypothetical protein
LSLLPVALACSSKTNLDPGGTRREGPDGAYAEASGDGAGELGDGSIVRDDGQCPELSDGFQAEGRVYLFEPSDVTFAGGVTVAVPYEASSGEDLELLTALPDGEWRRTSSSEGDGVLIAEVRSLGCFVVVTVDDGGRRRRGDRLRRLGQRWARWCGRGDPRRR